MFFLIIFIKIYIFVKKQKLLLEKFKNKKYILYSINVKSGGKGGGHWFSINYFKESYYETNDSLVNKVNLDYVLKIITGKSFNFVSRFLFELI